MNFYLRGIALNDFVKNSSMKEKLEALIAANKRVKNILSKIIITKNDIDDTLLKESAEIQLAKCIIDKEKEYEDRVREYQENIITFEKEIKNELAIIAHNEKITISDMCTNEKNDYLKDIDKVRAIFIDDIIATKNGKCYRSIRGTKFLEDRS